MIVVDRAHVLTNMHVVADGETLEVALAPPRSARLVTSAFIVAFDVRRDLALLRLRDELGTPAALAPIGPSLGDTLTIAGYPGVGGDSLTVTKGTVSGFLDRQDGLGQSWIKTDASINHGNSGGAALDSAGKLAGIPTFRISDGADSLAYVLTIQEANGFVEDGMKRTEALRIPTKEPTRPPTPAAPPPLPPLDMTAVHAKYIAQSCAGLPASSCAFIECTWKVILIRGTEAQYRAFMAGDNKALGPAFNWVNDLPATEQRALLRQVCGTS